MAKQESLLKFSGKLGNVIGYRSKKNYLLRSASAVVKQTSATKKAAKDFGTASKAGRLIRHALSEHLQHCYDSSLTNRLNKKLGEIVRADDTHKSGMRVPLPANMQSLSNFKFNSKANMLLTGSPVIENKDGNISISFPEKINNKMHIAIKAIALSVNFVQQTTRQLASETIIIKCGEKQAVPTLTLNPGTKDLTFIMLEIQSCYEVNNQLFPCLNKKGAVLDMIAVLPPVEVEEEKAETTKLKYSNTAPVLRIIPTYIQPARLSRKALHSLPEG